MNEAQVLDFARDAVLTMLTVATPIMLVGLVVGLTVAVMAQSVRVLATLSTPTLSADDDGRRRAAIQRCAAGFPSSRKGSRVRPS